MRSLVVLVSLVLFFPACSNNQVADKVSESKTEKRTESEKSRLENDSETVASELFESLKIAYEKKRTQWQEQRAKPMSPMEQQAHFKAHPASGYGEELVEFADKYPDSLAAKQAWMAAAKFAQGENKNRAADQVLQSVIADLDSPSTMEKLEHLMEYSIGEPQKKAMELMLAQAEKEKEPKASLAIIETIAMSRQGVSISDGVFLMPGNAEVREQAFSQLKELAESDIESDLAVKCFKMLIQNGSEDLRVNAYGQLLKHHPAHKQTMAIVSSLGHSVTAENKAMIEQAIECPDKNASANALIALAIFHDQKEREFLHYETAPPMHLMGLGETRASYLKTKLDPAEVVEVEKRLSEFVQGEDKNTDADVLAAAKKQLFEMQNLAIGKLAPEIAGQDLDGVEFKLSDYRGQVVLLDFWGDW